MEGYERWERTLIGLRLSPFLCTQMFEWGADCIQGDHHAVDNPFHWDKIVLNLPGQQSYNPKLPWMYKWDGVNHRITAFFETYIDGIRPGGATKKVACEASRWVASSWIQYLGQEDAPRKRRPPLQTRGAWAGAMCLTEDKGVFVSCLDEKWNKGKFWVSKWCLEILDERKDSLDYNFHCWSLCTLPPLDWNSPLYAR